MHQLGDSGASLSRWGPPLQAGSWPAPERFAFRAKKGIWPCLGCLGDRTSKQPPTEQWGHLSKVIIICAKARIDWRVEKQRSLQDYLPSMMNKNLQLLTDE